MVYPITSSNCIQTQLDHRPCSFLSMVLMSLKEILDLPRHGASTFRKLIASFLRIGMDASTFSFFDRLRMVSIICSHLALARNQSVRICVDVLAGGFGGILPKLSNAEISIFFKHKVQWRWSIERYSGWDMKPTPAGFKASLVFSAPRWPERPNSSYDGGRSDIPAIFGL